MSDGLFDDVPLMNKERDNSWEAFIKRKDVKAMFSEEGFGFPLNRGYYDLWCIAWAKAWDKGFMAGRKREWVGLTDEERNQLWRDVIKWGDPSHDDVDLMKAIEAELKEKNT